MSIRACCTALALSLSGLVAATPAPEDRLPADVLAFLHKRELCDHFRGEPLPERPTTPELRERRQFLIHSMDTYCTGSDARLAALKRRHARNKAVMERLAPLDPRIE